VEKKNSIKAVVVSGLENPRNWPAGKFNRFVRSLQLTGLRQEAAQKYCAGKRFDWRTTMEELIQTYQG